ncbi:MAG: glycosyltransferase [Burkholderiales bacterium]|nr:glycosyltransferase [Burkholderiales bacterium]
MKKILLIHQNFPGQFKHLYPELVRHHEAVGLTINAHKPAAPIRLVQYSPKKGSTAGVHPWVGDLETKVIRAEAAYMVMLELRESGFTPDLVIAHPGWGESLFIKEVWPNTRLAVYCEFFYHLKGADVGFDPEFEVEDIGMAPRLSMKNVNMRLHMDMADAGIAPTQWQASVFPKAFQSKISVIHDGVDTDSIKPNPAVSLVLGRVGNIDRSHEIITFVNRNLEPMRGCHQFIRALPELMRLRPNARILIVGGDSVSYGKKPDGGKTWKQIFLDEVREKLDLSRIHFLGMLDRRNFTQLLQISTVHVYLTYPFVLSWSLMEAMSAGCAIVASQTKPVEEVIFDDETGVLTDFFNPQALAEKVAALAADPERRKRLGEAARAHVVKHYDLKTVCLPKQMAWVESLLETPNPA